MDYAEIGQRIKKYRKVRNISQEQLAEMVNISASHMSHIETGVTKLSLQVLVDISVALDTSTDSLLFAPKSLSREELSATVMQADDRQLDFLSRMVSCMKACL
ncbi:MAG: helix-turn-helix transcriptional regulator [Treponema sp.]|nr:helix-turn-helix transcriptional regulator [Treponema sp.]MBQ6566238.1 helix-turn-helix transcriptional regulator [Treponema sp.]